MAKISENHSKKSSWKRNLLWFLGITVLFTGLGVAGGAALGTFAIPFLGTIGGIIVFGSTGFGLAMLVGAFAAVKGIKNWLSKRKTSNTFPEVEKEGLENNQSLLDSKTQYIPNYQAGRRIERQKKSSVIDSISDFLLGKKKTSQSISSLANDSIPSNQKK